VFDWDGDGLKDLVCSSDTGVYWCRNTNSNSNPILQAPVPLCAPVSGTGLTNICTGPVPGARMRLELVDWNNDGVMDVLLGDAYGNVYYYEGYHFGIRKVTPQGGNKIALTWASAAYLNYSIFAGSCVTNLHDLVATNLPSGGNATAWTNEMQGNAQFFRVKVAQ
jgi:hypothetical protein